MVPPILNGFSTFIRTVYGPDHKLSNLVKRVLIVNRLILTGKPDDEQDPLRLNHGKVVSNLLNP